MHNAMALYGALAAGELPKRVPVICNLIDQGAAVLGMNNRAYYSSAQNVAEGQLRLLEKYGHDVVWGAHYIARISEIVGAKRTLYVDNGPPNVGDLVIKKWDDIEKLTIPKNIAAHPSFEIQAETIRLLKHEVAGNIPVCAFAVGAFSLPTILMGIDGWMELLLTGPTALVSELMTKCSDLAIALTMAFRTAGADFVAYANPCASTDFFSLSQIEALALPWIIRDATAIGNTGLIYFCGGARIEPVISLLMAHTPYNIFYLNPFDDIVSAKTKANGNALVVAPVNDILLIDHSSEAIREMVRQVVAKGAPNGAFLLGTLMMPCQIPEANIHTMIEAAHEFGTYTSNA